MKEKLCFLKAQVGKIQDDLIALKIEDVSYQEETASIYTCKVRRSLC